VVEFFNYRAMTLIKRPLQHSAARFRMRGELHSFLVDGEVGKLLETQSAATDYNFAQFFSAKAGSYNRAP
jgi:hypothetical protein